MLEAGECASRADLARQLEITRARVSRVQGLLELAPEVVNSSRLWGPIGEADRDRAQAPSPDKEQVAKPDARGLVGTAHNNRPQSTFN